VATPIFETSIKSLPLLGRGKVRDIYAVDADKLLIVTSDRLSAFDVILPDPIPDKGRVLVALANFWFDKLGHRRACSRRRSCRRRSSRLRPRPTWASTTRTSRSSRRRRAARR
jgi:phosphoribosylaminoimidazole-succinocarboxamide synthase